MEIKTYCIVGALMDPNGRTILPQKGEWLRISDWPNRPEITGKWERLPNMIVTGVVTDNPNKGYKNPRLEVVQGVKPNMNDVCLLRAESRQQSSEPAEPKTVGDTLPL